MNRLQGRMQDFKLGGALKIIDFFGVFRVKNHDFTQTNLFFSVLGGARPWCAPPPLILPWIESGCVIGCNMSRRRQKNYKNNSDKYNDRKKRSPKREVAKRAMYNRNQRQKIEEKIERQKQYTRGSRQKATLSMKHV